MKSHSSSENSLKSTIAILIIGGALVFLFIWFLQYSERDENTVEETQNVKEMKIGNLTFKLMGANLYQEQSFSARQINATSNHLSLVISVSNDINANKIENVSSYCGKLLFEDGTQYDFDVTKGSFNPLEYIDLTGICSSAEVIPGATIQVYDEFYFSDTYHPGRAIAWEDIPGSRIGYFMQQKEGLVRFSIDKKDVLIGDPTEFYD